MNTAELNTTRQELIDWINSLTDTSLLNLLNSIKLSRVDNDKGWWNDLTPSQKENIKLGLKDLDQGNIVTSKEFWQRFNNE